MTKTRKNHPARRGRERRISVRAIRRTEPDFKKLGRALLAIAQAEADAAALSRPASMPMPPQDDAVNAESDGEARHGQ